MKKRGTDGNTAISNLLLYLAVFALVLANWTAPNSASARTVSSAVSVTARVMPFAQLTMLSDRENLVISKSDIARGYVEINNASLVQITSNTLNGCYLVVEVNGFSYAWATITLQGRGIVLPENGGLIHWTSRGKIVAPVNFVIGLKPGTKPGVYPWPFRLSASKIY